MSTIGYIEPSSHYLGIWSPWVRYGVRDKDYVPRGSAIGHKGSGLLAEV